MLSDMTAFNIDRIPERIEDPAAWYGPSLAHRRDWIEVLSPDEIDEVDRATRRFEEIHIDPTAIRAADFPLPTLAPRLARILSEVQTGRGFVLIRGLDLSRFDRHAIAVAFVGLGVHLGNLRPQNAQGDLLGNVRDLGLSSENPNVRIYQTHERQTYHTDSCDIVALFCLNAAKVGGLSTLVSGMTIYNEMRATRPDLTGVLFEPIETDRRGEVPPGKLPYFRIPVFNWYAGLLSVMYHRQYIESARRFAEVPPLTPRQTEALDMFDTLTNDVTLNLQMEFQPGDIQLVHNHTVLHDRTAFEDWPDSERRRHLLRLWLAPMNARALPPVFTERYGTVTPGERGGIVVR